ncbi:hypothetical protein IWX46DRAFT_604222 [Phyllosticta citricarpa]|uniref:Secreted protein n=1 Tax=Phyllosticta citricarpa TaxID=55181 RepID=A0ABR1M5Y6_9PEZI
MPASISGSAARYLLTLATRARASALTVLSIWMLSQSCCWIQSVGASCLVLATAYLYQGSTGSSSQMLLLEWAMSICEPGAK